ncbi:MAG TPA: GGDEF domain-containing protein [Pseudolabrys sp.]
MHIDLQTLAAVTVFVTAVLGALLVFAGVQNRAVRSLNIWGIAFGIGALGLGLVIVRGLVPDWLSINIANALVLFGLSLIWAGARIFDRRPVRRALLLVAPALWLTACAFPAFLADINLRIAWASGLLGVVSVVTAREVWRGRSEPLMSRWPTIITLLAYAASMLVRVVMTLWSPLVHKAPLISGAPFTLLSFGTLLFTVVLAFLLLNMTKERLELQYKTASLVDSLCGVPNRRAFLEGINRLLARQSADRAPIAVILFDLDRFKDINDRLGHAVGDTVLQVFATTATRALGTDVMFGRIGGEEFAAALAVRELGEAVALAERARRNFESAAVLHGAGDLTPTVSVGVTFDSNPQQLTVKGLLAAADRALYGAKSNGRNRVESAAATADASTLPAQRAKYGERRTWRKAAGV